MAAGGTREDEERKQVSENKSALQKSAEYVLKGFEKRIADDATRGLVKDDRTH